MAIAALVTSIMTARPIANVTTAISATDATTMPSRNAPALVDARMRGTNGPLIATNMKAGRKMPIVATIAPLGPASIQPRKVAVEKTGLGVTWERLH